jgi:hypothetical protein
MSGTLPHGFAPLERWDDRFRDCRTAFDRDALRGRMCAEERQAFHAAMTPLLPQALEVLDAKPLAQHDAAERALMRMVLVYAHIAQAVEVHGPDEPKHARQRQRIPITRAPADL